MRIRFKRIDDDNKAPSKAWYLGARKFEKPYQAREWLGYRGYREVGDSGTFVRRDYSIVTTAIIEEVGKKK